MPTFRLQNKVFFFCIGVSSLFLRSYQPPSAQDLQNIKNVKGCRDGMPKVCKQGRDDIIVKVSLQSLIPASFSH